MRGCVQLMRRKAGIPDHKQGMPLQYMYALMYKVPIKDLVCFWSLLVGGIILFSLVVTGLFNSYKSSKMLGAAFAAVAALLPITALAQGSMPMIAGNGSSVMPNGKYQISAEGIRANFIPYGASISNLFINDTHGVERDIVLGFDNASYYSVDKLHPHLGGVPGKTTPDLDWTPSDYHRPLCQPYQELDFRDRRYDLPHIAKREQR